MRLGLLNLVKGEWKGRKFPNLNGFVYVDEPGEVETHSFDSLVEVCRSNCRLFGDHSRIVDMDTGQLVWESEKEFDILQVVGFEYGSALVKVISTLAEFQSSLTSEYFREMFDVDAELLWLNYSEIYKYNFLKFYGSLDIDEKQIVSKYVAKNARKSPYKIFEVGIKKHEEEKCECKGGEV